MPLTLDGTGTISGVTDFTSSNIELTDPQITGGVYLGGTGTANKLDDYEEGTWTPVFGISKMDYSSMTGITVNDATYTKIGNVVRVQGEIEPTGADGSTVTAGSIRLGGLPFLQVRTSDGYTVIGSSYARSSINSGTGWHGLTVTNNQDFEFFISVNGAQPNGSDGNDQPITFCAVYETND
jgi:hypothetical protein